MREHVTVWGRDYAQAHPTMHCIRLVKLIIRLLYITLLAYWTTVTHAVTVYIWLLWRIYIGVGLPLDDRVGVVVSTCVWRDDMVPVGMGSIQALRLFLSFHCYNVHTCSVTRVVTRWKQFQIQDFATL